MDFSSSHNVCIVAQSEALMMVKGLRGQDNLWSVPLAPGGRTSCQRGTNSPRLPSPCPWASGAHSQVTDELRVSIARQLSGADHPQNTQGGTESGFEDGKGEGEREFKWLRHGQAVS